MKKKDFNKEVSKLGHNELGEKAKALRLDLFKLKTKRDAAIPVTNTNDFSDLKRQIARVETAMNAKKA